MAEITKNDDRLAYLPEDDSILPEEDCKVTADTLMTNDIDCISSEETMVPETTADNSPAYSSNDSLPSTVRVLKPMSLIAIIEEVFSLYKSHGMVLLKSMAIINLPSIVVSFCTIGLALVSTEAFLAGSILLALGGMPFQMLAMIAAPAVIAKIVSDSFLMKEVDLWESLDLVWQKIGTVASAMIGSWVAIMGVNFALMAILGVVIAILVGGGMAATMIAAKFGATALMLAKVGTGLGAILSGLLLIFGGFVALGANYAMLFLSPVVAVIEDKSWFDAPKRSFDLVFKSSWSGLRFLGVLLVVWVSIGIASMFILGPIMLAAQLLANTTGLMSIVHVAQSFVGLLSALAFVPVGSAATALLYYDYRIRYENFSLDELMKSNTGGEFSQNAHLTE